ncbi:MAG: 3-isopropylmalate dehydratase small subunit [Pseudomonadota bacterium]
MSGWVHHHGPAVALDHANVDTDQIIPARFMSTPRAEGYGRFLLHDLRHDADGRPDTDMPLNRVSDASVLIAGRNFGTGSSREAAVYALVDFGIRAVIAPSFGDIFAANAVNNGLLPAQVAEAEDLIAQIGDGAVRATIDLEAGEIKIADRAMTLDLDPIWLEKLIRGWDDIDLTAAHAPTIAAFRAARADRQPWTFPAGEPKR